MTQRPHLDLEAHAFAAPEADATRCQAHGSLLRVVRTVIRADSDPARQTLFAHLVRSRPVLRLIVRLHRRFAGTRLAALVLSGYGLAAFVRIAPARHRQARVLAVAGHENARRQVEQVMSWIGPAECAWLRTGTKAAGAALLTRPVALVSASRVRATLRVIRAVDRRHGFLVSCRVAAAIAWYARSKAILAAARPGAVLVSSDSNPEEAGFIGAARVLGVPQVYVSHAYPTPFSPPLDFSLSILEGDAALQAHREKGAVTGQVLLAGLDGDSAPLDPLRFERARPSIGIFPPKAFSWTTLAAIVDECRSHFDARQVVIRWHPSMLDPPRLGQVLTDLSSVVESTRSATLPDVARQCDWVVAAENSNVHLPVMKLGIPTVVVKGLGLYPESRSDLYGFVAHGIVFPPVPSLREIRPEAVRAFFTDGWPARFSRYDASYLRSRTEIANDVRRAVWAIVAATDSPARAGS